MSEELINIDLSNQISNLKYSPAFEDILKTTPVLIRRGSSMIEELKSQNLAEADDEMLDKIINDANTIRKYDGNINAALKEIRKRFNNQRDATIDYIKQNLSDAHIDELSQVSQELLDLKRDIQNSRRLAHWQEISNFYQETISTFSNLVNTLPNLTKFETFQANHTELDTASKNWKLSDKIKKAVNTYISQLDDNLSTLTNLNSPHFYEVVKYYDSTGNLADTITVNTNLIKKDQEALEAKRQYEIQKQKELAELKAQAEIEKQKAVKDAENKLKEKLLQQQKVTPTEDSTKTTDPKPFTKSPLDITNATLAQIIPAYQPLNKNINDLQAITYINQLTTKLFNLDPAVRKNITTPQSMVAVIQTILNNIH